MAQNENSIPNAQMFIAAFTQCNVAAKGFADQLISGILLDTTHNMVQLIQLLTLQFDNLLKQIQELQARIETINKTKQEVQQQHHQYMLAEEIQSDNIFQNLYAIIAKQLKVSPTEMKNVIHRNIVAEDSEKDLKYAQLLDNNKVNTQILQTLCMAYKCKLFIYNGRSKQKSYYGESDEKIIRIFHIRNKYSLLKKQSDRFQKHQASNYQDYKKSNQYKYINNRQKFKEQELADTINQVVKEVIADVRVNQYKKKQQQQQLNEDPQTYDQEEIFCQKCGSGPYATAQSYKSHIPFKHDGKTPSKNKFHKNLRFTGK